MTPWVTPAPASQLPTSWQWVARVLNTLVALAVVMTVNTPRVSLAAAATLEQTYPAFAFIHDSELKTNAIDGSVLGTTTSHLPILSLALKPGESVLAVATAYSSDADQTDSSPLITASGERVGSGVIAANFVPLGTHLKIGHQTYTVKDRMNARYNNTYSVDLWMPSTEAARHFGVRMVEVTVLSLP